MRYYIANSNRIPLKEQPNNGYTKLQVIERVQREIEQCVRLYGGQFQDYKSDFVVLNNKFHEMDFMDVI